MREKLPGLREAKVACAVAVSLSNAVEHNVGYTGGFKDAIAGVTAAIDNRIAEIEIASHNEGGPDPAAEALRAAAPDLYESLAAVVAVHDNETSDLSRMSFDQIIHHGKCWERARKALKKAVAGVPDREKGK